VQQWSIMALIGDRIKEIGSKKVDEKETLEQNRKIK
jgi:hypothetical protein